MLISPEVRNAIHVGDRILEINGLPVGTLMQEEVGLFLAHISDTHGVIWDLQFVKIVLILRARPLLECNLQSYVLCYTYNACKCNFCHSLHSSIIYTFFSWERTVCEMTAPSIPTLKVTFAAMMLCFFNQF